MVSPASDAANTPLGAGGMAGSPASGAVVLGVPTATVSAATSLGLALDKAATGLAHKTVWR